MGDRRLLYTAQDEAQATTDVQLYHWASYACCATATYSLQHCSSLVRKRAEPEVLKGDAVPPLKWGVADEDGLVKFLVEEKSFSEERIRKVIEKVNASRSKATQGGAIPLPATTAGSCQINGNRSRSMCGLSCRAPGVLLWAGDCEVIDGRRQTQGAAQARKRQGLHCQKREGGRRRRREGRGEEIEGAPAVLGMLVRSWLKQRRRNFAAAQKLCPMNLPKLV